MWSIWNRRFTCAMLYPLIFIYQCPDALYRKQVKLTNSINLFCAIFYLLDILIESNAVTDESTNKNDSNESKGKEDFLDYGEKVVKPGDVLHLPTVKTTIKEGENKTLIVARVSTTDFHSFFAPILKINFRWLQLAQYLEKNWSCTTEIPSNPPEFAVWSFTSHDSVEKMSIELGVK